MAQARTVGKEEYLKLLKTCLGEMKQNYKDKEYKIPGLNYSVYTKTRDPKGRINDLISHSNSLENLISRLAKIWNENLKGKTTEAYCSELKASPNDHLLMRTIGYLLQQSLSLVEVRNINLKVRQFATLTSFSFENKSDKPQILLSHDVMNQFANFAKIEMSAGASARAGELKDDVRPEGAPFRPVEIKSQNEIQINNLREILNFCEQYARENCPARPGRRQYIINVRDKDYADPHHPIRRIMHHALAYEAILRLLPPEHKTSHQNIPQIAQLTEELRQKLEIIQEGRSCDATYNVCRHQFERLGSFLSETVNEIDAFLRTEYRLIPLSEYNQQYHSIGFECSNRGLSIQVIGSDGKEKKDTIPWASLEGLYTNFPKTIPDILKNKNTFLPIILRALYSRGLLLRDDRDEKTGQPTNMIGLLKTKDAEGNGFWNEHFGQADEVNIYKFAARLQQHELQTREQTFMFDHLPMMLHVITRPWGTRPSLLTPECVVTVKQFEDLLRRFGPMHNLTRNMSVVIKMMTTGEDVPWFVPGIRREDINYIFSDIKPDEVSEEKMIQYKKDQIIPPEINTPADLKIYHQRLVEKYGQVRIDYLKRCPAVLRWPSSPTEDFVVSFYEQSTAKIKHRLIRNDRDDRNEGAGYQLIRLDTERACGIPEYAYRATVFDVLAEDIAKKTNVPQERADYDETQKFYAQRSVARARYGVKSVPLSRTVGPGAGPIG